MGHHVERRTGDLGVVAHAERARHRHAAGPDSGDDAVLSDHVVRSGQHLAERRTAEHEVHSVGRSDPVGEVRTTACDQLIAKRRRCAVDVGRQPGVDTMRMNALGRWR
jgi:hypothetical protein